jgi:uncharacterized protein
VSLRAAKPQTRVRPTERGRTIAAGTSVAQLAFPLEAAIIQSVDITFKADASTPAQLLGTDRVRIGPSPIHGVGQFARRDIPGGTPILEYVGETVDSAEALLRCARANEYIFSLGNGQALDGNVPWNPARFLNHSCAPSCEARFIGNRIWLIALRDIAAGEELTFNYGYDLEDYRSYPCHCGAPDCVGYIVAEVFFEHLRRQRSLGTGSHADGSVAIDARRQ